MCYRFYIDLFFKNRVKKEFSDKGILVPDGEFTALSEPRDVYPSEKALVIAGSRGGLSAESMGWGFSNPVSKGLLANARSESIKEKPTFRESAFLRRCAIPASGFYEWDPHRAKFRFTSMDGGLLLFAGFYREEQGIPRYTILTTEANDSMIRVHDRMPVMIGRHEIRPWIEDDAKLPDFLGREQAPLTCEQESGQISFMFE